MGLKNEATLIVRHPELVDLFDFVTAENCGSYCWPFNAFIQKGKAVLAVQNMPASQKKVCSDAKIFKWSQLHDFKRGGWVSCK